jgi:hypothetical protein
MQMPQTQNVMQQVNYQNQQAKQLAKIQAERNKIMTDFKKVKAQELR